MSTDIAKDPTDPAWAERSGGKGVSRLGQEIHAGAGPANRTTSSAGGYIAAQAMVEVLKRAGDDLTRANMMKIATNMEDWSFPLLLPGHHPQHVAGQLFPDAHDADQALRRHALAVHRQADLGVSRQTSATRARGGVADRRARNDRQRACVRPLVSARLGFARGTGDEIDTRVRASHFPDLEPDRFEWNHPTSSFPRKRESRSKRRAGPWTPAFALGDAHISARQIDSP